MIFSSRLILPAILLATVATASTARVDDLMAKTRVAHAATEWWKHPAIQTDFVLHFGGKERMRATLEVANHGGHAVIRRSDGAATGFDGTSAWLLPADAEWPGARFDVLTWPYFLAAPYKLNDKGTHLEPQPDATLQGKSYKTAKLTFEDGVGDAPKDWYLLYLDPETGRLDAMAYIVTFSKTPDEANKEPHCITYHDFKKIDGVPIPMKWKFWKWKAGEGVFGEPIGEANLSNVRFIEPATDAFSAPPGSREVKMPGHE